MPRSGRESRAWALIVPGAHALTTRQPELTRSCGDREREARGSAPFAAVRVPLQVERDHDPPWSGRQAIAQVGPEAGGPDKQWIRSVLPGATRNMISGMIWAPARPGGQIFHGKKGELYQRYHELLRHAGDRT